MISYRISPYQLLRVNSRKVVSNGFGLSHIHSPFLSTVLSTQTGFVWGLLTKEHALVRIIKSKKSTFHAVVISLYELKHHLQRYSNWLAEQTSDSFQYSKLPKKEFHVFRDLQFLWLEILKIKDLSHHVFYRKDLEHVQKILEQWKQEYQIEKTDWCIKNSSLERIVPRCTIFLQCGGCQLLHISYETSLKYKEIWLKEQLDPLIKSQIMTVPSKIQMFESSKKKQYRNHVQIHINKYKEQGFYAPGTYRVAPFPKEGCLLFEQKRVQKNFPKELELKRCVRIRISEEKLLYNELNSPKDKSSLFTYKVNYPLGTNTYITCSNRSFFQINTSTLAKWLTKIKTHFLEIMQVKENSQQKDLRVLELFSGFGFITQMIAQELSMNVLGIDILKKEDLDNVYFQREDESFIDTRKFVENYISCDLTRLAFSKKLIHSKIQLFQPNVLLLNPPRNGFEQESLNFLFEKILLENKIKTIIYSSCNASIFVRDLEFLAKHEYRTVTSLSIFDFFPNTHHYEVLAVIKR